MGTTGNHDRAQGVTGQQGPQQGADQRPVKRSVRIAGHPTSISLEPAFWTALKREAARRRISLPQLIAEVDAARETNLSSALRLAVLDSLERQLAAGDESRLTTG